MVQEPEAEEEEVKINKNIHENSICEESNEECKSEDSTKSESLFGFIKTTKSESVESIESSQSLSRSHDSSDSYNPFINNDGEERKEDDSSSDNNDFMSGNSDPVSLSLCSSHESDNESLDQDNEHKDEEDSSHEADSSSFSGDLIQSYNY
ncbi:unnamed protein product [Moneuplotes crassus]|uniref:Uncharacterized protein n=1 Tax=Euplotes crassus TaxID=5936 RepID=A0AAD2D1A1_EUPCR|nr:unnamed protein product [Moneuplotes crassus]